MKFRVLADYLFKIEETASRLEMTQVLADLFKKIKVDEARETIYLLQGRVAPLYLNLEFGMAEKMVVKSIIQALQIDKRIFSDRYKKIGDIGKTAESFRKELRSFDEKDLGVKEVFDRLKKITEAGGTGSQEEKINILSGLIAQLDPLSCRYLARIPVGAMRMGFSDVTVLDAYSWMIEGDKSLRSNIEKAYHVRPDLGLICVIIKEKGVKGLDKIKPEIFTPIIMMRAERLSSGAEIIEKIGKCAIEPKYDGFRLQIHFKKDKTGNKKVKLYSRNLDDVSYMYPDIIEGVKKEIRAEEIIFEGEAIGFDPHGGSFLPFQETVQRKRKYNIEEKAKEIPLKLFVFELLYLNGESYLKKPYFQRKKEMEKRIELTGDILKDVILTAPETIVEDSKKLEMIFDDSISKGLEGIIAKKLDGIYQAGARGWNWIKFKRSYSTKINDSMDCLVMGYDYGKGKRAGFGIGAFLVGVYNEKKDIYETVAKIGTGLTDEEWRELKIRCGKYRSEKKPAAYDVDDQMGVDIWVKPQIVVEIKADEITRSSVHTAGRVLKKTKSGSAFEVDESGYALRFPRLERFREDKRPEDTTTLKELKQIIISR